MIPAARPGVTSLAGIVGLVPMTRIELRSAAAGFERELSRVRASGMLSCSTILGRQLSSSSVGRKKA
jgi:hypothetical protein